MKVVIDTKKLLHLINSTDMQSEMMRVSVKRLNEYIQSSEKNEIGERRLLRLQTLLLDKGYMVIQSDDFKFDSKHVILDDTVDFIRKVGAAA